MDIISIVNSMQPGTIARFALRQSDFPNGQSGIPFMGGFAQLFPGATLPDPASVTTYVMPEASPPVPDLATQLAAALIAANVIPASAIDAATLIQVNATLTASGQQTITLQGAL